MFRATVYLYIYAGRNNKSPAYTEGGKVFCLVSYTFILDVVIKPIQRVNSESWQSLYDSLIQQSLTGKYGLWF